MKKKINLYNIVKPNLANEIFIFFFLMNEEE